MSEGQKLLLTTKEGTQFRGILVKIDEVKGILVLKNVVTCGSKLFGPQHFCVSRIQDIECEPDSTFSARQKKHPDHECTKQNLLFRKNFTSTHLNRLDTDELATSRCIFGEAEDSEPLVEEETCDDFFCVDDCTVINIICDKFFEAILYIMEQDIVGITFEGVNIGRDGTLSLIQVSTRTDVIIFDMLRLGEKAFVEGLHCFLESKVCKIIHDCRWISDMLYHVYGINICNVYDTEVACAYVYSICNRGDWPRHVESLPGALKAHLGLSHEQVFTMRVRERSQRTDQEIWLQRPLPEKLLEFSCKNVRYLIQLYQVLLKKMMLVFKVGVDLYLHHVRDTAPGNVEKLRASRHLLPMSFTDMTQYVQSEIANMGIKSSWMEIHFATYDKNGFRTNSVQADKDDLIMSRDSIWHRSDKFYEKFRNCPKDENSVYKTSEGMPPEERDSQRNLNRNPVNELTETNIKMSENYSEEQKRTSDSSHPQDTLGPRSKQQRETCLSSYISAQIHPSIDGSLEKSVFLHNHVDSTSVNSLHSSQDPTKVLNSDRNITYSAGDVNSNNSRSSGDLADSVVTGVEAIPRDSKIRQSKLFQLISQKSLSPGVNGSDCVQSDPEMLHNKSQTKMHKIMSLDEAHVVPENSRNCDSLVSRQQFCLEGERQRCDEVFRRQESMKFISLSTVEAAAKKWPDASKQRSPVHMVPVPSHASLESDALRKRILNSEGSISGKSATSSDNESSDNLLNVLPAGHRLTTIGANKARSLREKLAQSNRTDMSTPKSSAHWDGYDYDDLGIIPMQGSLKRDKFTRILGTSTIGNPFQEDFNDVQPSKAQMLLTKNSLSKLKDAFISDGDIQRIEESDIYRNILKKSHRPTASAGSSNTKSRWLLPPKVKLLPKPGS